MGFVVKGLVFKNEHESNGDRWYSYNLSVSNKNMNGDWQSASIPIRFRKGIELVNKTRIEVTEGWLTVINYKDRNVVGIFANAFDVLEGASAEYKRDGFAQLQDEDIPF